jgi:hypothetical protein
VDWGHDPPLTAVTVVVSCPTSHRSQATITSSHWAARLRLCTTTR